MKQRIRALIIAVATLVAGSVAMHSPPILADESTSPPPATPDQSEPAGAISNGGEAVGVSGNLHFTDEDGNPRHPTAAEVRATAEAFEKDMERLAGPNKGKLNLRTEANGAISATIANSRLVFLTAVEGEDGTLTLGHSAVDDGDVAIQPATSLPEM